MIAKGRGLRIVVVATGAPVIGEPLDPPGGILILFQVCLGLRLNKECINQKKKKASNPSNISIKQTQKRTLRQSILPFKNLSVFTKFNCFKKPIFREIVP